MNLDIILTPHNNQAETHLRAHFLWFQCPLKLQQSQPLSSPLLSPSLSSATTDLITVLITTSYVKHHQHRAEVAMLKLGSWKIDPRYTLREREREREKEREGEIKSKKERECERENYIMCGAMTLKPIYSNLKSIHVLMFTLR